MPYVTDEQRGETGWIGREDDRFVHPRALDKIVYVALGLVMGCRFDPSGLAAVDGDIADPSAPDAGDQDPVHSRVDAGALCASWRSNYFDPCALEPEVPELDLVEPGSYGFDTDSGVLSHPGGDDTVPMSLEVVQQDGTEARLLLGRHITVGEEATLRVTGSRPLALAAWSTVEVLGRVDLTSRADSTGAGADPAVCESSAAEDGQSGAGGGGGGGGGAFAGSGGHGGSAEWSGGGDPGRAVALPTSVRGGCAGGRGGSGAQPGVAGGAGGGAILLAARHGVSIAGSIEVGGAGGRGGLSGGGGGGGGGSGGLIAIEAESIEVTASAFLFANGGGGGGGGSWGTDGGAGQDGEVIVEAEGGSGGDADNEHGGGDGGNGGQRYHVEGHEGESAGSGGGGGGGVGFIVLAGGQLDVDPTSQISPALSLP